VDFLLAPVEVRILGSLLEKDITTPEYYPLTMNALLNACNQKSNRDPVVTYQEDAILLGTETLKNKGLVVTVTGGSNRVPKIAHRIGERLNLRRPELAILCELMLRGPQTPGELRARASRFYEFGDLDEVETTLRGLIERQPDPLVAQLPRQPGSREVRYAHLLSGQPLPDVPADTPISAAMPAPAVSDRTAVLEAELRVLRGEVDQLKEQFAEFRRQFE
jgi:uncharacterized protein YceH (UPF0502 family)